MIFDKICYLNKKMKEIEIIKIYGSILIT